MRRQGRICKRQGADRPRRHEAASCHALRNRSGADRPAGGEIAATPAAMRRHGRPDQAGDGTDAGKR